MWNCSQAQISIFRVAVDFYWKQDFCGNEIFFFLTSGGENFINPTDYMWSRCPANVYFDIFTRNTAPSYQSPLMSTPKKEKVRTINAIANSISVVHVRDN